MLSPSSSISNLPNNNKKFKSDDISGDATAGVKLTNGDGAYLTTKVIKTTELNDVTNNENSENINLTNGEMTNGALKHDVEMKETDKSTIFKVEANAETKNEVDDNNSEMINETEVKDEQKVATSEEVLKSPMVTTEEAAEVIEEDAVKEKVNGDGKEEEEVIVAENEIEKELEKLNDNIRKVELNNSSDIYRSKRNALKQAKSLKLKQLQIDLKNEEAKLILLKRLYYSQRISNQPLTQQQQLLKQQQMQQHAKNQQLKKANAAAAALNNQAGTNNGHLPTNNQRSIINNKNHPQLNQNRTTGNNSLLNRGNQINTGNINKSALQNGTIPSPNAMARNQTPNQNARNPMTNQPLRQLNNTSSAVNRTSNNSPVNVTNSKMLSATASPSVQTSINAGNTTAAAAASQGSTFSPKAAPEKISTISQTAVSQLVRKELEKSLAQIEFPKPPAQDIYFLPNTNNSEFLMCLGLEEVAKCVQEHLIHKQIKAEIKEAQTVAAAAKENDPEVSKPSKADTVIEINYNFPLFCAQCSTDFSPVWRQDKNGLNLCEKCLKNLEKKQIKTEHNARLKQAFLKAVKDKETFEKQLIAEQQKQLELQREQRLASPTVVSNTTARSSPHHTNHTTSHQRNAVASNNTPRPNSNNTNNNSARFSSPQVNNRPGQTSQNNSNSNSLSRQQQQALQQRRSLQTNSSQQHNQKAQNLTHNNKPGMNNISNNMKPNSNANRNSTTGQFSHGPQNHSMQKKHEQTAARAGQSSVQSSSTAANQRNRQSTGSSNHGNQKPNSSSSSRTNDSADTAAALQAQAAQLQLAAAFANTPALAAFAQQQQQQQQQAAILQRLMASVQSQNNNNNNFNPLHSLGLQPNAAALNYLNMFPNQKQWKNP